MPSDAAAADAVIDETNEQDMSQGEKQSTSFMSKIVKALGALAVLAFLVLVGFFVGIYLRIFDVHAINEKIREMPSISQYFGDAATSAVDSVTDTMSGGEGQQPVGDGSSNNAASSDQDKKQDSKDDKVQSGAGQEKKAQEDEPKKLTKDEIEKQRKALEAAEKKRVSKLARLYSQMKPADAALILEEVNDDIVIAILQKMEEGQSAQILSKFDPSRSARITRAMYAGVTSEMTSLGDSNMQPIESATGEAGVSNQ